MKFSKQGRLIVFEGPDGVGKTTFAKSYTDAHPGTLYLSFPGRSAGSLGSLVYTLHHSPAKLSLTKAPSANSMQALHIAAHLDAIERVILPTLSSGSDVLLDRFWWSTQVYGKALGGSEEVLHWLIGAEKALLHKPDLLILFESAQPKKDTEYDELLWNDIKKSYQKLAQTEKKFYPIETVVNEDTYDSVLDEVFSVIHRFVSPKSAQPTKKSAKYSLQSVYSKLGAAKPTRVYDT